MKRSEMVEEIRKILDMNGKDNGYGELEEAILHTVEHFGMLPPLDEEVAKQVPYHVYDAYLSNHMWEEE